jgi:glycosyltransferase involved in cell wall biosynthesis
MRRLLLLNTDLEVGGTPAVVRELAVRLHDPARGVEVEVACLAPWGPVADEIWRAGIAVTPLDAGDVFDLPRVARRLVQRIARGRFDTVFSFLVHANSVAAIAARFCDGVRFVQSVQTAQSRPAWHWWMQAVAHHAAEAVVVPSPSVAQAAEERSGVPREKIVIIPNAVDVAAFADARARAARVDQRGAFDVVFIGRLDPVKRIPDLLRAIERLRDLPVRLSIYGEGEQRDELAALVGRLGLGERVTLRGTVPAPRALADADLLVLPSEAEGFGLVLIEAMAAGVPIVATAAPGIRDVVEPERTALMVPVGETAALAGAIARAAGDSALRRRLAGTAAAVVKERYVWDRVIPHYRRVLGVG